MTAPPERRTRLISLRRPAGRPRGKAAPPHRHRRAPRRRPDAGRRALHRVRPRHAGQCADDSAALGGRRGGQAALRDRAASPATAATRRACRTGAPASSASAPPRWSSRSAPAGCRWPARRPRRCARPPQFTLDQARQIGAVHPGARRRARSCRPVTTCTAGGDVARGGELFRVNCSSCHAFAAGGGALSSGKSAPALERRRPTATSTRRCSPARRTCRSSATTSSRPRRSATSSPTSRTCRLDQDPGGWGLGRYGPVPEGLAIFLIGMVALVFTTLWIAGKS